MPDHNGNIFIDTYKNNRKIKKIINEFLTNLASIKN